MARSFVGFGFGPIQSALFLYEAYQSGNFDRFTVAEVDPRVVAELRLAGGTYQVNIARKDGITPATVRGVNLLNPAVPQDREQLIAAIADADEIATALPSVAFYDRGQGSSVVGLLAEGFAQRGESKPGVVYTAENNNHAAEILEAHLKQRSAMPANVQVLNTVIGKMSGVVAADATGAAALAPLTPGSSRFVLVEEFNRILVSKVRLPGFARGIPVFAEKEDLLPFEEAKLYGHNAVHALLGYLAEEKGLVSMAQVAEYPELVAAGRQAFLDESRPAMLHRHKGIDPLFTPEGYAAYAEDLLDRMLRPTLNDQVARVTRDPVRKLAYTDRLVGTMRLALAAGVTPRVMARGAAAALHSLSRQSAQAAGVIPGVPASPAGWTREGVAKCLRSNWASEPAVADSEALVALIADAMGLVS